MGKFTDTKYENTVDSLIDASKGKLNNPYYKFSDKKPTKCTFYHQNREKTTTDEASKDIYQHVGESSSIKFNKINNFFIYGFNTVQVNHDVGEYGLESAEISGTVIVLPNTVVPYDGDFFAVTHIDQDLLFKVNSVTPDTLDDGSNVYQVEYKLEKIGAITDIEKQVVSEYNFIVQNVGTEFNPIITSTDFELIEKLDVLLANMTSVYQIFFDESVQNFVYKNSGAYMYDPWMIEFIIRNKLMSHGDSGYIHVAHSTSTPRTFGYDYSRTFYHLLENPSKLKDRDILNTAGGIEITEVNSLFTTRLHSFYQVEFFNLNPYMTRFNIFPAEVIDHIKSGEYFADDEHLPYNLMIAYFNDGEDYIKENLLDIIEKTEYCANKEFFYLIPIDIFIINRFIETLM